MARIIDKTFLTVNDNVLGMMVVKIALLVHQLAESKSSFIVRRNEGKKIESHLHIML